MKKSKAAVLLLCSVSVWAGTSANQTKLLADDGAAEDAFGYDVAMYGDTVVVGATKVDDDTKGVDVGVAYVFTRTQNGWKQQARLMADDGFCRGRVWR